MHVLLVAPPTKVRGPHACLVAASMADLMRFDFGRPTSQVAYEPMHTQFCHGLRSRDRVPGVSHQDSRVGHGPPLWHMGGPAPDSRHSGRQKFRPQHRALPQLFHGQVCRLKGYCVSVFDQHSVICPRQFFRDAPAFDPGLLAPDATPFNRSPNPGLARLLGTLEMRSTKATISFQSHTPGEASRAASPWNGSGSSSAMWVRSS